MIRFLKILFNLQRGEQDKSLTLENVKSNISFKGSNLWILMCAIIIACVGLNVNSGAVIIGAMLISPLMGPIVGAGFALGMYDFSLLRKSLSNLLIATVAALAVATLYFLLSPFKQAQSELLSRTAPNIYDVLIAFCGGLVGVIAITRVEKGNPIPGVAIATALMPPLCTAGYGLATGNMSYFFGALFLYSINCVFICISTFFIVKYLQYPAVTFINEKIQKRVRYGITTLIVLMLLPSAYFAYTLYQEQKFKQQAEVFIQKEFVDKGNTLVYKYTSYKPPKIEVAFLKKNYTADEIKALNEALKGYGLGNTKLIVRQNSSEDLQALRNDILNEVNVTNNTLDDKDKKIASLEQQLSENHFDNSQLLSEADALIPSINLLSVSRQSLAQKDTVITQVVLLYGTDKELDNNEAARLKIWAQRRLSIDSVRLVALQQ